MSSTYLSLTTKQVVKNTILIQTAPDIGYGHRSQKECWAHLFLCFKVLAVTGLVHQDFRVDKVAPKDKYFQHYFCGMFSQ